MKYILKDTILEGPVKSIPATENESDKRVQKISIVGDLCKDSGEAIMPLTDTIDVVLTSDSISQCEKDIQSAAEKFTNEKYSG